jgi:hypothetical protein
MQKIIKSIRKKDEAVAGIVVAVMIVGLVLAVISIIQTIYIPKWMESREAEHMGVVSNQFSDLKYTIDTQIALKQDVPVSTSITLGSRELGFFISNKAFGRLALISDGCALRIVRVAGDTYEDNYGILRYTSENAYFLNQIYNYEIGGIVLNQTEGAVFIIKPEFTAQYNASTRVANLSLTCIDLIPNDEKTSISGYGTYPVRTEYLTETNTSITSIRTFTIMTPYATIWYTLLNTTLADANLVKNTDYTITKTTDQVTITFNTPPLNTVNFMLIKVQIAAQITPGWSD